MNSIGFFKALAVGAALACSAHSVNAETVLKLGTVGFKGMPIGCLLYTSPSPRD